MLDLMKWAEGQYHRHLREAAGAEAARRYLQERGFGGETIERYGLWYAPDG